MKNCENCGRNIFLVGTKFIHLIQISTALGEIIMKINLIYLNYARQFILIFSETTVSGEYFLMKNL